MKKSWQHCKFGKRGSSIKTQSKEGINERNVQETKYNFDGAGMLVLWTTTSCTEVLEQTKSSSANDFITHFILKSAPNQCVIVYLSNIITGDVNHNLHGPSDPQFLIRKQNKTKKKPKSPLSSNPTAPLNHCNFKTTIQVHVSKAI